MKATCPLCHAECEKITVGDMKVYSCICVPENKPFMLNLDAISQFQIELDKEIDASLAFADK